MKKYKITYNSKGYLNTPVPSDEFYVAQAENEAVAVEATFPANVIGTVRAYIEYPGGGTITECGVLSVNNHSAIAVLSSDNLRYHYIKVGFEVVNGSKEMRYEPVTLEVDRFVNPSGSVSPSPYTVTVKIGSVTELEPGEAPTVNNVGTEKNIVLDFGIPKGEKGDKGEPGTNGEDGYTPVKGVDYFTDAEKEELFEETRAVAEEVVNEKAGVIQLTSSGEAIQLTDSSYEKLKGFKVFGKTEQQKTTGKNLLQIPDTLTASGLTVEVKDGVITVNGTATGDRFLPLASNIVLQKNTDYVLSGGYSYGNWGTLAIYMYLYDSSNNIIGKEYMDNGSGAKIHISDDIGYSYSKIYVVIAQDYTANDVEIKPQLELGTVKTDFEPYSGGFASPSPDWVQPLNSVGNDGSIDVTIADEENNSQTIVVSTPNGLRGVPVTTGGNYTDANGQQWVCDEVDFEKGVYIQRTKTIDISELSWNYSQNPPVHYTHIGDGIIYDTIKANSSFSTHYQLFIGDSFGQIMGDKTFQHPSVFSSQSSVLIIKDTDYTNATDFKNYLTTLSNEGNPVMLCYILAEQIETPLTEEQLIAYKSLQIYKPITNITNDENAYVKVDYVADTKTYIDNKFAELQAMILEG